jgi:hypothetical protein
MARAPYKARAVMFFAAGAPLAAGARLARQQSYDSSGFEQDRTKPRRRGGPANAAVLLPAFSTRWRE